MTTKVNTANISYWYPKNVFFFFFVSNHLAQEEKWGNTIHVNLVVSCRLLQGANRIAGCSWDSGQKWHCHWGTLRTPPLQCSTTSHRDLQNEMCESPKKEEKINWKRKFKYWLLSLCVEMRVLVPICLLVISTVAFLLTLLRSPRQKRSELEGSVKPSTVRDGWEAWNVSPTRWFSS